MDRSVWKMIGVAVSRLLTAAALTVPAPLAESATPTLDQLMVDIDLLGTFNVLRAAGRIMSEQRKGNIILFSSIRSLVVEPGQAVYAATKAGVEHIGIIVAGTDHEITLRDPAGAEHTVALADIAQREFIGSLMPAGLTDQLSPEDLRDLFAYLTQLGKPR